MRQNALSVQEIYVDGARKDARTQDLVKLAASHDVRVIAVDAQRLDGLTGNARHQGVAARGVAGKPPPDLEGGVERLSGGRLRFVLGGVSEPRKYAAGRRGA